MDYKIYLHEVKDSDFYKEEFKRLLKKKSESLGIDFKVFFEFDVNFDMESTEEEKRLLKRTADRASDLHLFLIDPDRFLLEKDIASFDKAFSYLLANRSKVIITLLPLTLSDREVGLTNDKLRKRADLMEDWIHDTIEYFQNYNNHGALVNFEEFIKEEVFDIDNVINKTVELIVSDALNKQYQANLFSGI